MFGGKLDGGSIDGRIDMMVPVWGERVRVAGETTRLLSLSKMTALVETNTVRGTLESWGGVGARFGRLSLRFIVKSEGL